MSVMHLSRSFGIAAHVDAGKTTLSERILFHTGRLHRIAEVHDGGAATDPMPSEKKHGISIQAAATHCSWNNHSLTLVDTPGHIDFAIEVERSLRVLDGAVLVLCAVGGVQAQTTAVHRQLTKYKVPYVALINKCDRLGSNPERVLGEIRAKFQVEAALVQLPIGLGSEFSGVVDLVAECAYRFEGERGIKQVRYPIPPSMIEASLRARERMLDAVSLFSDELSNVLLDDQEPSEELVHRALRQAVSAGMVPVLVASAYKDIGVQPVLDAVVRYLPSPEGRIHFAQDLNGETVRVTPDEQAPTLALAFKRQESVHGTLSWIRVYRGVLRSGDVLTSMREGGKVRIRQLVQLDAGKQVRVQALYPGQIGALPGVGLGTGDTLCAEGRWSLPGVALPEPVVEVKVVLGEGQIENMVKGLRRLVAEDPSLQLSTDAESGELRLRGMGELHLEIAAERLAESGVSVVLGSPHVALRKTPAGVSSFNYFHRKQDGGVGQYARVIGRVEPSDDLDVHVAFQVSGDGLPREYRRAITRSVQDFCAAGLDDSVPLVGMRVVFTDGATHATDSSDQAFSIAARKALKEVFADAALNILEPRMSVEVAAPSERHGSVLQSLLRRSGTIVDAEVELESRVVAEVPLAQMFGYAGDLRAATSGTGDFSMNFARYGQRR